MIYRQNTVGFEQLVSFYHDIDSLFNPALSSQVNLLEYIKKVYNNATIFECWDENQLVGLIACYANDFVSKKAYITSVAVLPEYQGYKIASTLLKKCLDYLVVNQFNQVSLEVNIDNIIAQTLYSKIGFIASQNKGIKLQMHKML